MEISSRRTRASQLQSSLASKQRRSGYEPSDTETEWHETPWNNRNRRNGDLGSEGSVIALDQARNVSPLKPSRGLSAMFEDEAISPIKLSRTSPTQRRHSKSPYKPRVDDGNLLSFTSRTNIRRDVSPLSPRMGSDIRKNISPFSKSQRHRATSPYKSVRENHDLDNNEILSSNRKQNHRQAHKLVGLEDKEGSSQRNEISKMSEKANYSRRSLSAPRPRGREKDEPIKGDRTPSPLPRTMTQKEREAPHTKLPSMGEINEMVANAKASKLQVNDPPSFETTDSISQGDIFFSRDFAAMTMQKIMFPKNGGLENQFSPTPKMVTDRDSIPHQRSKSNGSFSNNHRISSNTVLTRTTTNSSSTVSRQSSSKISTASSKLSGASEKSSGSFRKFTDNRRKNQTEAWFSCIKKGSCKTSKSPENDREFDEALFIEKAFVVESLRQFWADKYQPRSLNGFTCHKQEAQLLKQLVSHEGCPHILLKGPPGSGKKALIRALLREMYGDPAWNISHDLRYFHIQ